MTNGNGQAPSAIAGNTLDHPSFGGVPLRFILPMLMSGPTYSDLPPWWTPQRDMLLAATLDKEDMWSSAVARTATKFAAHGYVVKDQQDSTRKVSSSQELLKKANGGEGWVPFALKIVQEVLTQDNGVFIRIRRAGETAQQIKVKAKEEQFTDVTLTTAPGGAKISGLYHLDSQRCMRTGNLGYPVRYQPLIGPYQLLRWDQVLIYADMPSPRVDMFGVGRCAASRSYKTISAVAALRQLLFEFTTGGGANKLILVQGLLDRTLKDLIKAGVAENEAKGFVYYLGSIIGALDGDGDVKSTEIILKSLPQGFEWQKIIDDAYLIYANNIGVPVQDIKPLSGQGLGTGTQTVILEDAAKGVGIAAFVKWWEQTVSDRVLPATTELEFVDENDTRNQKAQAEVKKLRAETRKIQIESGELTPPIARQVAADDGDFPKELLEADATPGGSLSDDEKPAEGQPNAEALALALGLPNVAPQPTQRPALATKAYLEIDGHRIPIEFDESLPTNVIRMKAGPAADDLLDRELQDARALAGWARG